MNQKDSFTAPALYSFRSISIIDLLDCRTVFLRVQLRRRLQYRNQYNGYMSNKPHQFTMVGNKAKELLFFMNILYYPLYMYAPETNRSYFIQISAEIHEP